MPQFLGDRIRRTRLVQGLTQQSLAAKVGVSQAALSHWERNETKPNETTIASLEKILGPLREASEEAGDHQKENPNSEGAFGAWLRRVRTEKNMSVPELANAAQVSTIAIYNLEAGRSLNPQAATRQRLEKALDTNIPKEVKTEAAKEQSIAGLGSLTDFDPHSQKDWPKVGGVYVFYDISQRPIYVGEGGNIATRVKDHEQKFWFKAPIVNNASYIQIEDATLRRKIEQVLIKFLKSNAVLNKQHVESFDE